MNILLILFCFFYWSVHLFISWNFYEFQYLFIYLIVIEMGLHSEDQKCFVGFFYYP